jgi:hypothetical protein
MPRSPRAPWQDTMPLTAEAATQTDDWEWMRATDSAGDGAAAGEGTAATGSHDALGATSDEMQPQPEEGIMPAVAELTEHALIERIFAEAKDVPTGSKRRRMQ